MLGSGAVPLAAVSAPTADFLPGQPSSVGSELRSLNSALHHGEVADLVATDEADNQGAVHIVEALTS